MEFLGEKRRIFMRFMSDNVPGDPLYRDRTVARDLIKKSLGEYYRYGWNHWLWSPADLERPGRKCWMIIDLNVGEDGGDTDVTRIPYTCVNAKYLDEKTP